MFFMEHRCSRPFRGNVSAIDHIVGLFTMKDANSSPGKKCSPGFPSAGSAGAGKRYDQKVNFNRELNDIYNEITNSGYQPDNAGGC